jgi:8-oxo-dGTP pyrophosphatase MutT (NUDIX family)
VAGVHAIVSGIAAGDDLERRHRAQALRWLESTDDIYRRIKPATPPRHLVSYVVPVTDDGRVLLAQHRLAGLWLPPGGHVEPDEDPALTAVREVREELGIETAAGTPLFLTATRTVGVTAGHIDVSLWYPVACSPDQPLSPDAGEFAAVRWWTPGEVAAAEPTGFDPHLGRFLAKLAATGRP